MARSPQLRVSLSEKEYEQIQNVARELGISESMLGRNLIRSAIDDMNLFKKVGLIKLIGMVRSRNEMMGKKLMATK
jgi:hypothetical protein